MLGWEYRSVKDLLREFSDGVELNDLTVVEAQECLELRQAECKAFIEIGFRYSLERY